MTTLDDKLSTIVNELPFKTGMPFGGAIIIKTGFGLPDKLCEIRIPGKNNGIFVPKRAMSILSARDLYDLPGRNFMDPELNPVSRGIRTFCESFKDANQKDFEEYGREVLLEGLQNSKFSMSTESDTFNKYNFLWEDEIFRKDLGPTGLKQIGLFLRSYGRLPYPDENPKTPKSLRLFKEKIEVVIGSPIEIPGQQSEKLLVPPSLVQKHIINAEKIYSISTQEYQYFDQSKRQSWIFNVSVKDAPGCIHSGLSKEALCAIASYDNTVLSGRNINVFVSTLKKAFVSVSLVEVEYDKKIDALKFKTNNLPDRHYAKGLMPFLLTTGRFPTVQEIMDYNKIKIERQRGER